MEKSEFIQTVMQMHVSKFFFSLQNITKVILVVLMMVDIYLLILKLTFEIGCYFFCFVLFFWKILQSNRGERADNHADSQSLVACPGSLTCSDSAPQMLGCAYNTHKVECSLRKIQVSHRSQTSLLEWGKCLTFVAFLANSELVLVGYKYKHLSLER